MAEEEIKNLKDAIIDLYLAIKIRSTEEVYLFPSLSCELKQICIIVG